MLNQDAIGSRGEVVMLQFEEFIAIKKREYVLDILKEAKGNQCAAAELAGIHRNTLNRMVKDSGIRSLTLKTIRSKDRYRHQPKPQPRYVRKESGELQHG